MKNYNALVAAVTNLLNMRSDYEDLRVELDCLEDALRTGTREELLAAVNAFFADNHDCPFGDMDVSFQQLSTAADALNTEEAL